MLPEIDHGRMFASHQWMHASSWYPHAGRAGHVEDCHPHRGALLLMLTLLSLQVPLALTDQDIHFAQTLQGIALFNNRSRNLVKHWVNQAYIDHSVNLAGMLWRCTLVALTNSIPVVIPQKPSIQMIWLQGT